MLDAAIFGKCRVEVGFGRNIQSDNQINVEVAMAKLKVFLAERSLVWRNIYLNKVALNLVAEVVSLLFVERNNKILEAVCIGLKSLLWFEELDRIWDFARKNRRCMLAEFIENSAADNSSTLGLLESATSTFSLFLTRSAT